MLTIKGSKISIGFDIKNFFKVNSDRVLRGEKRKMKATIKKRAIVTIAACIMALSVTACG